MNVIEFNNLTKYYGDVKGCKNVDFNVKEGEIFGFIGPNDMINKLETHLNE